MKTVRWYPSKRHTGDNAEVLHIEAEGCVVNIHVGLIDRHGRRVTRVDVNPDDEQRGGDGQGRTWRLFGAGAARVVRLNTNPRKPRKPRKPRGAGR